MNYQKKIPTELEQLYKERYGQAIWDYSYYAWPHMFGSTAGPHGGIGGAAMSMFTVECYYFEEINVSLLICDGEYDFVEGFIKARDALRDVKWKRIAITPKESLPEVKKLESIQLGLLRNPKNPK